MSSSLKVKKIFTELFSLEVPASFFQQIIFVDINKDIPSYDATLKRIGEKTAFIQVKNNDFDIGDKVFLKLKNGFLDWEGEGHISNIFAELDKNILIIEFEYKNFLSVIKKILASRTPQTLQKLLLEILSNTHYFEKEKISTNKIALASSIELFSHILRLYQTFSQESDLSKKILVKNFLDEFITIIQVLRANVYLVNPKENTLEIEFSNIDDLFIEKTKIDFRFGVVGQCFISKMAINHILKNNIYVYCFPLQNQQGKVIGILEILKKEGQFSLLETKMIGFMGSVLNSLFEDFNPFSSTSLIREFSTPIDRQYPLVGQSLFIQRLRKKISPILGSLLTNEIALICLIGEKGTGKKYFSRILSNEWSGNQEVNCENSKDLEKIDFNQKNVLFIHNPSDSFCQIFFLFLKKNSMNLALLKVCFSFNSLTDYRQFTRLKVHPENHLTIHFPPLNKRKEDIPLLVSFFIKQLSEKNNILVKKIHQKVLDNLLVYSYPENILELQNIVEKLFYQHFEESLIEEIPTDLLALNLFHINEGQLSLREQVLFFEKAVIDNALKRFKGNKTKASLALGLTREGLRKKMIHMESFEKSIKKDKAA